jgi:uncharacterized C2H2 Zn-finger protein
MAGYRRSNEKYRELYKSWRMRDREGHEFHSCRKCSKIMAGFSR